MKHGRGRPATASTRRRLRLGSAGLRRQQEEDGDRPQVITLLAGVDAFAAVSHGDLGELDAGADQARGQAEIKGGAMPDGAKRDVALLRCAPELVTKDQLSDSIPHPYVIHLDRLRKSGGVRSAS